MADTVRIEEVGVDDKMTTASRRLAKTVKIDAINRKILTIVQAQSDISNAELADRVGLSPAACSQRTNALKDAGYFISFHAEIDLDRICEHVVAYVEFKLEKNDPAARARFAAAIEKIPEFMDCLRLSGEFDFISFTCAANVAALTEVCDSLQQDDTLGIARINTRFILDRAKWYLGYPVSKLRWLE